MKIHKLPLGLIDANMYIVEDDLKSVIIDPCVSLEKVKELSSPYGPILITHCHYDHINKLEEIRKALGVEAGAHPLDIPSFPDSDKNGAMFFMSDDVFEKPKLKLNHNDKIQTGEDSYLQVIHTPGHTRGSICFLLITSGKQIALFSGDTLFKESAGRTDLGGNPKELDASLAYLASLDENVKVYPGHGEETDIAHEKKYNPFMRRAMR